MRIDYLAEAERWIDEEHPNIVGDVENRAAIRNFARHLASLQTEEPKEPLKGECDGCSAQGTMYLVDGLYLCGLCSREVPPQPTPKCEHKHPIETTTCKDCGEFIKQETWVSVELPPPPAVKRIEWDSIDTNYPQRHQPPSTFHLSIVNENLIKIGKLLEDHFTIEISSDSLTPKK